MDAPAAPEISSIFATRYRIEGECGRGATSVVYRARDLEHNRDVAIKVIRAEFSASSTAERFLREMRIASSLEHPHIARLLDSGAVGGALYCVLPFIDGETLRQRIAREGPLPLDDAIRLTKEVAGALSYAHARGIIHRDVKPENILLEKGRAILTDFGIARAAAVTSGDKLTDSGIAVGTPSYMSPEQAAASAVLDARSDEYALAVCLYEMLAGDPPFVGRTSQAVIARQMAEPPPRLEVARPSVPGHIVVAVERALAKVPADRFDSVESFVAALDDTRVALVRHGLGRRRIAIAVVVGAVVVGAAAWLFLGRPVRLDRSLVMVFPARTAGSGSDPEAGLRVADAIQVALEHTEPLRWLPAWEYMDVASRRDPSVLRAVAMRDLARQRHARYYVASSAEVDRSRTSVTLLLYDAAGDSLVARESASDSAGAVPPSALAIRALPQLLVHMLDPRARVDLTALTARRLPAIVRLLEGEEAYRRARFAAAFDRYREAVAEDSLFAYAALKGAQAASWQNRLEEATGLIAVARANEAQLPPSYRPYLHGVEAYLEGRGDSAVASFRSALGIRRYWAEAATALGDAYYHLLPSAAPLDSLAEATFGQAFAIDSEFTPPLFHLAEIALRRGDRARAVDFIRRLTRAGADTSWTNHLTLMSRCLDGGQSLGDWAGAARLAPSDVMLAARSISAGGQYAPCAAAAYRAVLSTPQVPVGTAWAAALGLHGVLTALGRTSEAMRLLDSTRTHISVRALAYGLIDVYADSGFRSLAQDAESFGLTTFGPNYERASPRTSWAFGVWESWKGNRAGVEAIAARVSKQAQERPLPATLLAAASLTAHAALLRGDTADALRRFASLPVVAPRDSVLWEFLEPLAPDRLTYARILLARGRAQEALAAASVFDHEQPVTYVAFARPSLELRARAADQMGRAALASQFRARLRALGDTHRAGR